MKQLNHRFFHRQTFILFVAFLAIGVYVHVPQTYAADNSEKRTEVYALLAKERGISIEEAEKRLGWQDRASLLSDKLKESLPHEDFGGVWIDEATDRVQVGVLKKTTERGPIRSTLEKEIGASNLDEATDFRTVKYSLSELTEVKDRITNLVHMATGKLDWPIQIGILTDKNQVMFTIPGDDTKVTEKQHIVVELVKQKYGEYLNIDKSSTPFRPLACNWWFCDSPLRGAVGIKGSTYGYSNGVFCTAGFTVVGNSGTRYILTAGHCHDGGDGWATETSNYTTKKIGPIHQVKFRQGGHDAMTIQIREDTYDWDVKGWVYTRSGPGVSGVSGPGTNEEYDINGTSVSGGLVGERICTSGSISSAFEGGSCGKVIAVDIDTQIEGYTLHDNVRASYCTRNGDSGAPVFRLGKALGMQSGTTQGAGVTCSDQQYYVGIEPVIRDYSNTINVF